MTIAYVITELHEGGAENALWQLCCQLVSRHSLAICCLHGADGPVAARVRELGIPVDEVGISSARDLAGIGRLREWLRSSQADVIHSWLFHANFATRLANPGPTPLVCGLRVNEPRRSHVLPDRWTRGKVTRYACVSQQVKAFAVDELRADPARCTVIENGVDFGAFESARTGKRPSDCVLGLTVARIARQKAHHRLLRGLATLPPTLDWSWRFVGAVAEPDYQAELTALASELGIHERIEWVGPVTKQQVFAEYANATAFALASSWEGQPNVVLEAMASGLPVICTRTDGIPQLLDAVPGCVRAVQGEPNDWSVIPELVADQALIAAGLQAAQARGWEDVARQYESLYQEVAPCAG